MDMIFGLSWRRAGRAKVDGFALKSKWNQGRQFRKVSGKAAHAHGLVVRLPIGIGFGDALEGFSRGAHFMVEFREYRFANCHT